MGMRGQRPNVRNKYPEPELEQKPIKVKRKIDNTTHHNLCCIAAKWLQGRWSKSKPYADYATVELVTQGWENTDVFGWNCQYSTMIEIKVSRSDFLKDKDKKCRVDWYGSVGNYKYYCCPEGVIKENDLPDKWGLLYVKDGKVEIIKLAEPQETNIETERYIFNSIFRREGINKKVFNYRRYEK
ncbi:hypothetical protein D0T53_11135 [Dysgonomonas sp. 216]|uniref:hypothetical protein n=1 Tax=Dysgonomonas sp. 216 TaxID=2302934 RepID=UPI0013D3CD81|nr:hypothetical protein [Dysgonomonas sp. 216]NDW19458.1 hypothetical protein [Dysgonomonas sp. 216]